MCTLHCGYWCPGAKAPEHQYPQCWLNMHCIGQMSCRSFTLIVHHIRKMHINKWLSCLTHWGRVTHICVSKLTKIGSDNGLSPGRRQAIIWTNDGILLIWPIRTNFSELLIEIKTFSFEKMELKMSSGKWRPFCLGLNELRVTLYATNIYTAQPPTHSNISPEVDIILFPDGHYGLCVSR